MLKVGMVGMGGISRTHRAAWAGVPEAKIAAVCDVRADMAAEAGKDTGAAVYTDFEKMLEAEALDILDICLPTYLHADCAVKAMDRGIHVLCEKPVSLRREDVARMYGAAERNDRRFMVAQVLRFWREYALLREAIQSERYGKLLSGSMTRLGSRPGWSWDNWMHDRGRSGLVPYDLHIHDLDYLVYTLGKPEALECHRACDAKQDYLNIIYQYPGCFVATEAAWYNCDYPFQAAFRFQFERAVMEYKSGKLTTYCENREALTLEAQLAQVDLQGLTEKPYYNEIRYFTDCVLNGKPCDRVRPDELEAVLDIIDRINRG